MRSRITAFCLCVAVLCGSAAEGASKWKAYKGEWFEVRYPADFTPIPVQKSSSSDTGYDGVKFRSSDGKVFFYVYSPMWRGTSDEIKLKRNESVTDSKTTKKKNPKRDIETITETWMTIEPKDKSYQRYLYICHMDIEDQRLTYAFGIQASDAKELAKYHDDYKRFKDSLVRHLD